MTLKCMKRAYAFCSVSSGMKIRTSSALSHPKCLQNKHLCDLGNRVVLQNAEQVPDSNLLVGL